MGIYFGRRLVIHILHQNLSEKARDTQPCLTFKRYQFSSVTQSCPTLCDPMDCSTLGLLVHHQLLEFTETHVHWVGDAIQPSHPLLSPFSPALNLSQHQDLFQWVTSLLQSSRFFEIYSTIIGYVFLGHVTLLKLKTGLDSLACISSVQLLSQVWLFETPWTTAREASLSITNSGNLSKLMFIESVTPSNHLILCCLFLSCFQ